MQRDNCYTEAARLRLDSLTRRRRTLEARLRVHYPKLRVVDSLFAEFHSHDFAAIGHRNYNRVLRELNSLQHRVNACAKFETLIRYRCANLFFLVVPDELSREADFRWLGRARGKERSGLPPVRKPLWHETSLRLGGIDFLVRIARAGNSST